MEVKREQVVYVDGKPHIKCGMVMLNANQESELCLSFKENSFGNLTDKKLVKIDSACYNLSNIKTQHLYITSNEEIKESDLFYNTFDDKIQKCTKHQLHDGKFAKLRVYVEGGDYNESICKKIIATTDTSLGLPQPSQQFIEKYIEEYNKGNIITEVLVEVEEKYIESKLSYISAGGMVGFDKCELKNKRIGSVSCGECENYIQDFGNYITCKKGKKEYKLKLDSHNQITIRKQKDSWTREEVIALCRRAYLYGEQGALNLHDGTFKEWIEENL